MARSVLIVDDDTDFVALISARLQAHGFVALVAFDALHAIIQAQKHRPDLIILDIRLPAGSGFRVLHMLRESHLTGSIPVIFVTGHRPVDDNEKQEIRRDLEEAGVPVIFKPFSPEVLVDRIDSVFEKIPPCAGQGTEGVATPGMVTARASVCEVKQEHTA